MNINTPDMRESGGETQHFGHTPTKSCLRCRKDYAIQKSSEQHCTTCGLVLVEGPLDWANPLVGRNLNGVVLEGIVGEGGMGIVYKALQLSVERHVAVKILDPTVAKSFADVKPRFFREAKIIAKLSNHPNIVSLYDFGQTQEGLVYFITELLEGETLGTLIQRRSLSIDEILSIVTQVCTAMSAAHAMNVIHRDLKPDNIFLVEDVVKILDFGLATDPECDVNRLTLAHDIIGVPQYLSPEQANCSEVSARSDIYSLGVIVYEMLTGKRPFPTEFTTDLLERHRSEPAPPLVGNIPETLRVLVMRMLEKNPDDRPQSMDEIKARIKSIQIGVGSQKIEKTEVILADQFTKKKSKILPKIIMGASILLVLLALLIAALVWLKQGEKAREIDSKTHAQSVQMQEHDVVLNQTALPIYDGVIQAIGRMVELNEKYSSTKKPTRPPEKKHKKDAVKQQKQIAPKPDNKRDIEKKPEGEDSQPKKDNGSGSEGNFGWGR